MFLAYYHKKKKDGSYAKKLESQPIMVEYCPFCGKKYKEDEKMRTIKFRAKDSLTGKWVYGYYYSECEYHYIIEDRQKKNFLNRNEAHPILLETLCEFTGILDRNGKEIYEHDLLDDFPHTMEVVFERGQFCIAEYDMQGDLIKEDYRAALSHFDRLGTKQSLLKVIGNMFDNKLKRD